MIAATLLWALAANVVRFATVAVFGARWGIDLTEGWRHEMVGFVSCLAAIGLVLSTDRLLAALAAFTQVRWLPRPPWEFISPTSQQPSPESKPTSHAAFPEPTTWTDLHDSRRGRRVVTGAYALLGLIELVWIWPFLTTVFTGTPLASTPMVTRALLSLTTDDLPAQWRGFERARFETLRRVRHNALGEVSGVWSYRLQDLHVSISIDGPFIGWHEVTECYRNLGWNVRDHRIVQPSISGASIMEVQLDRPSGQYARLFFSCFEENGNGVKRDWGILTQAFASG